MRVARFVLEDPQLIADEFVHRGPIDGHARCVLFHAHAFDGVTARTGVVVGREERHDRFGVDAQVRRRLRPVCVDVREVADHFRRLVARGAIRRPARAVAVTATRDPFVLADRELEPAVRRLGGVAISVDRVRADFARAPRRLGLGRGPGRIVRRVAVMARVFTRPVHDDAGEAATLHVGDRCGDVRRVVRVVADIDMRVAARVRDEAVGAFVRREVAEPGLALRVDVLRRRRDRQLRDRARHHVAVAVPGLVGRVVVLVVVGK